MPVVPTIPGNASIVRERPSETNLLMAAAIMQAQSNDQSKKAIAPEPEKRRA